MNEFSQIDDELLSAYLDDELAPAERARVEERLAADPAARRLLEELTTVSQAMKSLPPATLEADLRDSVLRRAERAMLVSGERVSARGPAGVAWTLPFGRSRRAWYWAGAAIAAGLLLMVFEQTPDKNSELPRQVAVRNNDESDRSDSDVQLRMPALESPQSSPAAAASEDRLAIAPAMEPAAGRELSSVPPTDGIAFRAVAPPAPARESVVARDEVGAGIAGAGGGAVGGAVGGQRTNRNETVLLDDENPAAMANLASMIVNVQCNPEAMQNRTMDALFAKNQIEVERPAADKAKPGEPQSVDVVVVEAEPAQVLSCIKDISDDQLNYVAINVEDRSPTLLNDLAAKTRAADVQQFNRGQFLNQQQVEIAPSNDGYSYSTNRGRAKQGSDLKTAGLAKSPPSDQRSLGYGVSGQAAAGAPVARSTASSGKNLASGEMSAADSPGSGPSSANRAVDYFQSGVLRENLARRASQKLATKADMLQVLFVFQCPTEPSLPVSAAAPAAAPDAAPKSYTPVEEGLKSEER